MRPRGAIATIDDGVNRKGGGLEGRLFRELSATVVFVNKLPGMSEQDYAKLVMASMAHGGHHHGGSEEGKPEQVKPGDHEHH
jgi:hypothetical protein